MLNAGIIDFITRCAPRLGVHPITSWPAVRQDLAELSEAIASRLPPLCSAALIFRSDTPQRMYVIPSTVDIQELIVELRDKRVNNLLYIDVTQRVISTHIRLEGIVRRALKNTDIGL